MKENFCFHMSKEMKDNIKKIVEDSFEYKESKLDYTINQLNKIYPGYQWNAIYHHKEDKNAYNNNIFSYKDNDSQFFYYYNKFEITIYPRKKKNNSGHYPTIFEDKEKLEEEIKSLSKEQSDLKDKINDFEIIIKKYESIIEKYKSKLEKIIFERELLQKIIEKKEDEIIKLKNEIVDLKNDNQQKKENDGVNKTFYTEEQMITLNFESKDSKLSYAIPCLKKDLFVDVEKKLYDKYPQYKERNNDFSYQGNQILRFKTIEENHLLSGNPIIIPAI